MRSSKRILLAGVATILALSFVPGASSSVAMKEGNKITAHCCR